MLISEEENAGGLSNGARDSSAGQDSSAHSGNLDFLRSFAVLAVLASHCGTTFGRKGLFLVVGRAGVLLFFVHTAFVLLRSLDRMHRAGMDRIAAKFYVQRIFRIYPLYLAAIALSLLLGTPDAPQAQGWRWLAANLLLIQNVAFEPSVSAPMWSLPYEMQMYIALPGIYLITRQSEPVIKLALLSFLAAWGANGMQALLPLPYDDFHQPLTEFVPCFIGGAHAFVLSQKNRPSLPFILLPVLVSFLACTLYFSPRPMLGVAQWGICAALGFALCRFKEVQNRWFRSVCRSIASYSYGIYLWHWPLLWIWFRRAGGFSTIARWVLFFGSLALMSPISYQLLEAPMIRLGRALAGTRSGVARGLSALVGREHPPILDQNSVGP